MAVGVLPRLLWGLLTSQLLCVLCQQQLSTDYSEGYGRAR